jgi:hypothetical protein
MFLSMNGFQTITFRVAKKSRTKEAAKSEHVAVMTTRPERLSPPLKLLAFPERRRPQG